MNTDAERGGGGWKGVKQRVEEEQGDLRATASER